MGGEPSTQETRGRGGEAGNCGQVGHAGGLGGRQVPPRAPPGRDVLRTGWHGPARGDSVHHGHRSIPGRGGGGIWASSACVLWGCGGEMSSVTRRGARGWGAGRAAGVASLLGASGAPR